MRVRRIPQQIVPLALIFAAAIAALIIARKLLVPATFGDLGYYRAAAVGEIAAQPISYAGAKACLECHDDIDQAKRQSKHRGLSCEVCHGDAARHVEAPDEVKLVKPTGRGYCPLCHGYSPARPTGFPQINAELHNPGRACMSCHNAHNPMLPHAPEECGACHRQIASQKTVSHHATLACTTCHETPEGHLTNPNVVEAQKPKTKELCGKCHGQGADSPPEIPRVDLESHGGRYVCWDCHYPHFPEAAR